LFANHVAEVPANGEVTKVILFPINKINHKAMQEILDENIKKGL
jgi:hypothetical protein